MKKLTFCCIAILGMIVVNAQQPLPSKRVNTYSLHKATVFPIMDLETIDSTIFNTSALANKTVLVDFWFTACPPCIKEIPFARQLQAYFASDTNVVFLNICIENTDRKEVWKKMVFPEMQKDNFFKEALA